MNTKALTHREMQLALCTVLSDFADYCEENGLHYSLAAGTLLGGVRHKGFIPWDDDIDVYMSRSDYDRLHALMKEKPMAEKYRLCSLLEGNSPYPFAKLEDTDMVISNSNSSLHPYLWIDIFPLDYIKDPEQVGKAGKRRLKYAFFLEMSCVKLMTGKSKLRALAKVFVVLYARIFGAFYWGKKIERLAGKLCAREGGLMADLVWGDYRTMIDAESFSKYCRLEFEGRTYRAMGDWDSYLSSMYGNYMQLPPEDKRICHGIQIISKKG